MEDPSENAILHANRHLAALNAIVEAISGSLLLPAVLDSLGRFACLAKNTISSSQDCGA